MSEGSLSCLGTRQVEVTVITGTDSSGARNEAAVQTIPGLLAVFAPASLASTWMTGAAASSQPVDGEHYSVQIDLDVKGVVYEGRFSAKDLKGSNGSTSHNSNQDELKQVVLRMIQTTSSAGKSSAVSDGTTINKSGTARRNSELLLALQKVTETCISMSVKEHVTSQLSGTFVRIVWKGELHVRENSNQNESKSQSLVVMLGESLNNTKCQEHSLNQENFELRECVNEWRKTATTLERDRDSRENELLQNFLSLLNQTKSKLRKALLELKEEKRKNRTCTQLEEQPAKLVRHERYVPNEADASGGEDEEFFDSDMVEHLAAGKSFLNVLKEKDDAAIGHTVAHNKRPEKRKHADPISKVEMPSSALKKRAKNDPPLTAAADINVNGDKRVNPHTGTVEIWGSHALFRDQATRELELHSNMKRSPCQTLTKKPEFSTHEDEDGAAGDASAKGSAPRETGPLGCSSSESEVDEEEDDVSEKSIELL
jgi:hypothetical protein